MLSYVTDGWMDGCDFWNIILDVWTIIACVENDMKVSRLQEWGITFLEWCIKIGRSIYQYWKSDELLSAISNLKEEKLESNQLKICKKIL